MIRPVELQGSVQRIQDMTQIKQNEDTKPLVDQNNIHNQFAKEIQHNQSQVVEQNNAREKESRFDAKEKGNGEYTGNHSRKKKEKDADDDGEVIVKKSSGFDVKI